MKVKVYSLTTDGDNLGIETTVYATEEQVRADIIAGLENNGHRRCKDGEKLSAASNDELSELWEKEFDGCCTLEEHTIEVEPTEQDRQRLALTLFKRRGQALFRTDADELFRKAQLPDAGNTVGGTFQREVEDAFRDADIVFAKEAA